MNNEIDRDSMLIYLNDLRTMETIIHEDDKKTLELNEKTENKKAEHQKVLNDFSRKKNSAPSKPSKEIVDNGMSLGTILMIFFTILVWGGFFILYIMLSSDYELTLIDLFMESWELSPIIPLALLFFPICSVFLFFKSKRDNLKLKDEMELKYTRELKEWEKKQEEFNNELTLLTQKTKEAQIEYDAFTNDTTGCLEEMSKEKLDVQKKLQEAYSAIIIPLQFRNIQGIYYLYDYMSTSNQGLSEALMQCNLDAIKQQLNEVIQLQGETIIQQAQQSAALYEQNQRILETAQATMNNTAVAAKYAQISATNAAVTVKLQEKNLAYQKADYWLK